MPDWESPEWRRRVLEAVAVLGLSLSQEIGIAFPKTDLPETTLPK